MQSHYDSQLAWSEHRGVIRSWIETGETGASDTPPDTDAIIWDASQPQVAAGDLLARLHELNSTDPAVAARRLSLDLTGLPPEPQTIARFSPDGKQLVTGSSDGTVRIWDAATGQLMASPVTYGDYDGDGQVDVVVDGKLAELASVDYGNVPQNRAWSLSGLSRTGQDDPAGNLTRLLAAHGMPSGGVSWDPETGVLTARGSLQHLRVAHAAAAAIEESANAGVAVEMRVIRWNDDPPAANSGPIIPANAAQALLRLAGAKVAGVQRTRAGLGNPVSVRHDTQRPDEDHETSINAELNPVKRLSGDAFEVPVSIEYSAVSGFETHDGAPSPILSTQSHNSTHKLPDGGWIRVDFPAEGEAKATTILLNIQSATVAPE
jgi:hypothetical protein